MAYRPSQPPQSQDPATITNWAYREFTQIAQSIQNPDLLVMHTFNAVPSKLIDGMIVKADGTHWDPGSGAGIYAYYGGNWVKL